jgi:nucleoside-diphosphate-sugar epimerase
MQTILGAGGAIGVELAKALPEYTSNIRLVGRNPSKVNQEDQLVQADLTQSDDVMRAVQDSEVVYITAGLPYNTKVWETTWPIIMNNVIEACKDHQVKLVFFDNVYMYDPDCMGSMTEQCPLNPASRKGKVRAQIARMVMDVSDNGDIQALIARSADFYGPSIKNVSMLTETVFKPFSQGRKAQCLGKVDAKHSYTYTPDAGIATALLGNTPDAYGQVWHLPTASDPYTMRELIKIIAEEFEVAPKYLAANKIMVGIIGLFVPLMKEIVEMMYQYERDYVFISDKFEKRFEFQPTPYLKGIREIMRQDYRD